MAGSAALSARLRERASALHLLILDVDGVMTDGRLIIGDDGQEYKAFHANDGLGLRLLQQGGIELAVITARTSDVVRKRAEELEVRYLYQNRRDKYAAFRELLEESGLAPHQTAFMGDDLIDLPVMLRAGLALTVTNAHPLVRQKADWCSERRGGLGGVRDACEMLLKARGSWNEIISQFIPEEHRAD